MLRRRRRRRKRKNRGAEGETSRGRRGYPKCLQEDRVAIG